MAESASAKGLSPQSRRVAGIILVVLPTVMIGGVSLVNLLVFEPDYRASELQQDFWRAGHAHAGIFLLLTLVALRYVDEASLSRGAKAFVRAAIPAAAILFPVAFFLSVLDPAATEPSPLIFLVYAGGAVLAAGVLTLGVGLLRRDRPDHGAP